MPIMSRLAEQTLDWVNEALCASYQDVAATTGFDLATVHQERTCRKVTRAMLWHLELDYNFEDARYEQRAAWRVDGRHGSP